MTSRTARRADRHTPLLQTSAAAGLGLFLLLGGSESSTANEHDLAQEEPLKETQVTCDLDLTLPGKMSDIVSNALARGLAMEGSKVRAFLDSTAGNYATGDELLKAAAKHFSIEEAALVEQVEAFKHVNCMHGPVGGAGNGIRDNLDNDDEVAFAESAPVVVNQFAKDVLLHVVLHEMGHALVREFDLPVISNEETLADAFATHYLTTYLPDRAEAVLLARVTSLMIEAAEVPRLEWTVAGEHNSDARRAYQIAALAVAADGEKYQAVAAAASMSESDVRKARDYGTEIHRSWRRLLKPFWMPHGLRSNEARLTYDKVPLFNDLCSDGLAQELETALRGVDWHTTVTIKFEAGEGGAGWSRSARTITVHGEYARRFIRQGEKAAKATIQAR